MSSQRLVLVAAGNSSKCGLCTGDEQFVMQAEQQSEQPPDVTGGLVEDLDASAVTLALLLKQTKVISPMKSISWS